MASSSAHRGIEFFFFLCFAVEGVVSAQGADLVSPHTGTIRSGRQSEPEVLRDYPFGASRKALPRTTPAPNSLCFPRPRHSPPPLVARAAPHQSSLLDARMPLHRRPFCLAARTRVSMALPPFRPRSPRSRPRGSPAQSTHRWGPTTNAASQPTRDARHAANPQRRTRPMAPGRARQNTHFPASQFSNPKHSRVNFRRGSNGRRPSLVTQIHHCVRARRSRDCQREACRTVSTTCVRLATYLTHCAVAHSPA